MPPEQNLGPPIGGIFEKTYEILSDLGQGSFGRVYKARQLSTGQLVAVKVLGALPDAVEDDLRNRIDALHLEMRLCATLSHPNIVRLADSGAADGRLYAVFEFVPGTTLKEVLRAEGKLGVAEAVHLMAQVLDALSCAHARGIVHRDIKPENVMITKTGARRNALVLDFGLGGFAAESAARTVPESTMPGELAGTAAYMAPEQLQGAAPSPRSDLYSWGLTLLECLSGDLPFHGSSPREIILKQLGPDPVAIPRWLRNHPLGRVLDMVLAKQPEKREGSIERLLHLLTFAGAASTDVGGAASDAGPAERERRQLTLMCCRLAISDERGQSLDIEEVDQVLQARHVALAEQATRAGGAVAAILADRVLVMFGYPHAREGDARRAARLAMELTAAPAIGAPRSHLCVDVRVGVHTGLVIIRDSRHEAARQPHDLTGMTPQIAAQLAERAGPGEVLVSYDTHRLLRHEFEATPVGAGASDLLPAQAFRLTGVRRSVAGVKSQAWAPDTPLVGREPQLRRLRDGWAKACDGHGSVIVITGEPGIGKSRLLQELQRHVGSDAWIELACAPENQNTPLRPVIDALLAMDESVEALLTRVGLDPAEHLPLFAALLSLPLDERYPPLQLSAERQKELTLRALVRLLLQIAVQRPTVLAVDNLHWADPTTVELMTLLLQEIRTAGHREAESHPRILALFTTRPELIPHWSGEDIAFLSLQRLTQAEVEAMVQAAFAKGRELPRMLAEQVVQRAEGVPLFVEEITRVVLDGAPSDDAAPIVEIPGSVRDLLTARLDSVTPVAHDTAQLAAVLGREFRYELLQAVSQRDAALLHQDLAELGRAGLLVQRRVAGGDSYAFRHALLRDAAYAGLTKPTRQGLHLRVAHALQGSFPDIEQHRPEILALHFEQGGETALAVDYWGRAGNESYRRAAYVEALSQLQHAHELVRSLDHSAENRRREVDVLVALGTVRLSTQGWAVPDVENTFATALDLCTELGGEPPWMVLYGIYGVRITRSDRAGIAALVPRLRALADAIDPWLTIMGHGSLGAIAFWGGDFAAAHRNFEQALRYYGEESQRLAYDAGLYNLAFEFVTLWVLGYADQAKALRAKAFDIAERRRDPYSRSLVLAFACTLAQECGETHLVRQWAEQLMALADEQRLYAWWPQGAIQYGHALVADGQFDDATALIREGLERCRALGVMCNYNYYLPYLARAYLAAGRIGDGLATVDEGLALCQTLLARPHEPELLRLRGELLRRQGAAGAEECFRRALAMAERDGARAYALRAATSLGQLLVATGRTSEARSVVQPLYDQFTEGFETRDLQAAATFCATLGEQRAVAGTVT